MIKESPVNANDVVTAFCASFEKGDLEATLAYLADDCVYHNIPIDPVQGVEAIRKTFEGFGQLLEGFRFEVLHQVADGNTVMNERVDYLKVRGKDEAALPVTGIFEVREGKIVAWRDYFDTRQFQERTGIPL